MRQPHGPGDIIEIDVIDADPGVFGPSSISRPFAFGYVFAIPGGSYEFDAWAFFHSRISNAAGDALVSESTDLVRGMQAEVNRIRVRTTVTWGPIGGNYWDSETNRLEDGDALAFASAVGVVAGLPAVGYDYDLGGLQPMGGVKTLARVQVPAA